MKPLRHTVQLLLLLLLPAPMLLAQEEAFSIGQGQGGLHFLLTFPQGEFKENSDDIGYGLGFDLGYVLPRMPLSVGLTGGFSVYGTREFDVPFYGTGNLVTVELTTHNNIATGHAFLRVQPQDGLFRPYVEGLVGLHVFWTESEVKDERYEDRDIAGSTNLSDAAFSYGAGGGVMFRVHRGESDTPGRGVEVFIDLKARYLYGGKAKYFDEKSITFDANGAPLLLEANALESTTDMLQTMIGVAVRF
ncbi:MAG: hypothetical protein KFF77_06545 [Bacteroidetes bacterium]|nr:hypothetical protein [Bacteroidota bacterium]